ncbi:hypothetical protein [Streptomyces sp. NPDC001415]
MTAGIREAIGDVRRSVAMLAGRVKASRPRGYALYDDRRALYGDIL